MTDRELLELAAKAAGLDYEFRHDQHKAVDRAIGEWRRWNPLEDDGDALRLAVKLRIQIKWHGLDVIAVAKWNVWAAEMLEPDHTAATRRAIVRAAAALAKEPAHD